MDAPLVYLDNNATTAVAPEVIEAMQPYFAAKWGNPSSMHRFGGQVMRDIEAARARVAALIHAEASEIVFTSCGTESNNMAIYGAAEILGPSAAILTSRVEHPAVLEVCKDLQRSDYEVTFLDVDRNGYFFCHLRLPDHWYFGARTPSHRAHCFAAFLCQSLAPLITGPGHDVGHQCSAYLVAFAHQPAPRAKSGRCHGRALD